MTPLEVLDAEFSGASDRAAAIVAAAVIDDALRALLEAVMVVDHPHGIDVFAPGQELGSYMGRVKIAFMLGLIDDSERVRLTLVAKIRNEFAHLAKDIGFDSPRIADRCRELAAPKELVPPRLVPDAHGLERLCDFKTSLADRSNPRAVFEEATMFLLYVLKGRFAQAIVRRPRPPSKFNNAAEPAGEFLAHAMVARRHAIEAGDPPEKIAQLQDQINQLTSIVVFAAAGANKEPPTGNGRDAG
ncbi:hypothetical protein [Stenotrophomonas maltophilia]|uniref:hypothetical protein n=1 Tax=Stenotrophomonas maltophilia TaxID=40324 RepID=UPI001FA7CC1E|nr:hypothetical protein [Stenotrophomonas maltophilia]